MTGLGSYSYVYGPLLAFMLLGVLVLLLRWAFGRGGSLVERTVRPSDPDDYGMLTAVSTPGDFATGEIQRRQLEDAGIKATLAFTNAGPRVMVFPDDEQRALGLLRQAPGQARG